MGKSSLRKLTAGLVIIAFLIQAASIAAPGWLIEVDGNLEHGNSLFYRRTCHVLSVVSVCDIKSFSEIYNREREKLIDGKVRQSTVAEVDFYYHTLLCKQTLTVAAASLSLIGVILQGAMFMRRRRHNVKLLVLSAVLAAVSAGIVLTVVCYDIVGSAYRLELNSFDSDRDHSYLGFPYCLAMLVGSAILLMLVDVSIASILFVPKPVAKKSFYDSDTTEPPKKASSDFDSTPTPVSTEFTLSTKPVIADVPASKPKAIVTVPTVPEVVKVNEKSDNEKVGQDNPVFSEKL